MANKTKDAENSTKNKDTKEARKEYFALLKEREKIAAADALLQEAIKKVQQESDGLFKFQDLAEVIFFRGKAILQLRENNIELSKAQDLLKWVLDLQITEEDLNTETRGEHVSDQ